MSIEWYRRIEPLPPFGDLQRGFAAEVADPLWLLARQWTTGEHLGEDASSPVLVSMTAAHIPLEPVGGLDPTVIPAEPIVEGTVDDWWTVGRRVRVGRAVKDDLTAVQRQRAAFEDPLPPPYGSTFEGEVDGRLAFRLGFVDADHAALTGLPEPRGDAWSRNTLDYATRFPVAGSTLSVTAHGGGDVDWYTADGDPDTALVVPPEGAGAQQTREVIPMRLQYPGAPHPRFWQIENHLVDIGGFPPSRAHLATTLLIELIAAHSNDWFLAPVPAPLAETLVEGQPNTDHPPGVGVVVSLGDVRVTDSFDDDWDLEPPADWSLFHTTNLEPSALVVWPTAATPITGALLDDIVLGVDEDANVLWAVELTVDGRELLEHAESLAALAEGHPTGTRKFTWLPTTTLPEHWHPYRIEPVTDESGATRRAFVQGLVSTATGPDATPGIRRGPRSDLIGGVSDAEIDAGADRGGEGHVLDAHAVPNQGLRLQRRYLLARGTDGRPVLWRERRRVPLLGGPVSHLRHDVFREAAD